MRGQVVRLSADLWHCKWHLGDYDDGARRALGWSDFGTNTGNVFLEFTSTEDVLSGVLRLQDEGLGIVVYDIKGSFEQGNLRLKGLPKSATEGLQAGELNIEGQLTAEGQLRGLWKSSIGTGGTFQLFPHDGARAQIRDAGTASPEQIHSATRILGAIRLYATDVDRLIARITEDFQGGRAVVTYSKGGVEVSRYADEFLQDFAQLQPLHYFKVTIQEPDAYGINRVVTVDLGIVSNSVNVQGVREAWVLGKAETIVRELRSAQKTLITSYRRFGVGVVNPMIFVGMLIVIPELEALWQRAAFVAVVLLLLSVLVFAHRRFIPNFVAYPSPERPGLIRKSWPSILSWVGAVTASLAAAMAYFWLVGGAPP